MEVHGARTTIIRHCEFSDQIRRSLEALSHDSALNVTIATSLMEGSSTYYSSLRSVFRISIPFRMQLKSTRHNTTTLIEKEEEKMFGALSTIDHSPFFFLRLQLHFLLPNSI